MTEPDPDPEDDAGMSTKVMTISPSTPEYDDDGEPAGGSAMASVSRGEPAA